jgi:hypothetical protein
MNFPMEYPFFRFFYWLVNTPGIGSLIVALAGISSIAAYAFTLHSIHAAKDEPSETYTYPTPALYEHDENTSTL